MIHRLIIFIYITVVTAGIYMKKEIDKLAWLYLHDGKLLVARSKNSNLFYIPGGKRELDESDIQALTREIKEEITVDLIPDSIQYAATFIAQADAKNSETTVKLSCYFAQFTGQLKAAAEIKEITFINSQDKAMCSLAAIKVIEWLESKSLIA